LEDTYGGLFARTPSIPACHSSILDGSLHCKPPPMTMTFRQSAFPMQPNEWRDVATFECISGRCRGDELTSPCIFRSHRTASIQPPQRPHSSLSSHNSNLSEIDRSLVQTDVLQLTVHDRTFHAFDCARTSPSNHICHRVRTNRKAAGAGTVC
jgi:hypothetical protein